MAQNQFFLDDGENGRKDSSTGKIKKPEAPKYEKKRHLHDEQSCDPFEIKTDVNQIGRAVPSCQREMTASWWGETVQIKSPYSSVS
jgi:hypothetical protein